MTQRAAVVALTASLVAAFLPGSAHGQTQLRAHTRYLAHIPHARVLFNRVTPHRDGSRAYSYDVQFASSAGFYTVEDGLTTGARAAAYNGALFTGARGLEDRPVTAHRAGIWALLAHDEAAAACDAGAGTYWHLVAFEVWAHADTCAGARAAVAAMFVGVTAAVGRRSSPTIPWPTLLPTDGARTGTSMPPAEPTATPAPQPRYLAYLSGDQNTQSNDFTSSGEFTVNWSAQVENTDVGFGFFSADLYSASGDLLDSIASATQNGGNTFVEHADCSGGCYIKVMASNMSYHLTAR